MGNYASSEIGIDMRSALANEARSGCLQYYANGEDFCGTDKFKNITTERCHIMFEGCCRDLLVCPKVEWYMYSVYSSAACLVCLLVAGIMWFTWNKMVVGAPRGTAGTRPAGR